MSEFEKQRDLICEALVREISIANRWQAVVEAWEALVHVRQLAKSILETSEEKK